MTKFYIHNGQIEKYSQEQFTILPMEYPLYIYETIRLYNTRALFLSTHIERLMNTLRIYKINTPQGFTYERIERHITRLLNVNKVYKGGVCKLYIYAASENSDWHYGITIEPLPELDYRLLSKGKRVLHSTNCIATPPFAPSCCSWHKAAYIMAAQEKQIHEVDIISFGSATHEILHSSAGDILLIRNDELSIISPQPYPLSTLILQIAEKLNYPISQNSTATIEDIKTASELAVINPIAGLMWVSQFNEFTYYTIKIKELWKNMAKHISESKNSYIC